MKQKILTLQTLYREGQIRLKDSGIEEYQLDAWYLLEYVTGISKASYSVSYTHLTLPTICSV